jgi:hypothetical protein
VPWRKERFNEKKSAKNVTMEQRVRNPRKKKTASAKKTETKKKKQTDLECSQPAG